MEESAFKGDIYDGSDFTARRVLSAVRDAGKSLGRTLPGVVEGGEKAAREKKEGSSRTFESGIRSESAEERDETERDNCGEG